MTQEAQVRGESPRLVASWTCAGIAVAGAVAHLPASDWSRLELLGLLAAAAMVSELVSVEVGRARFSMADVPVALALVILGPVPAALIGISGVVFDAARRRPPWRLVLNNLACVPAATAAVGTAWVAADAQGWVQAGSPGFAAGAVIVTVSLDFVMFVVIAVTSPRLAGVAFAVTLRGSYVPMLPWTLIAGGLVGGTAHAAATLGDGPLFVLAAIIAAGQLTLLAVDQAERREAALEAAIGERDRHAAEARAAAARAREQVAWEVHDDPLQMFVAARQDLRDLRESRELLLDGPLEKLDAGLRQLRRLLRERAGEAGDALSVAALEAELSRQDLRCKVRFDVPSTYPAAGMLTAAARELVRNAAHAGATQISVDAWCTTDGAVLEVRDDGVGYDPGIAARRRAEGHLGLELLDRRVTSAGGRLEIAGEPGRGTKVTITLPGTASRSSA